MAKREYVNAKGVIDWINSTEAMYQRLRSKERIAAAALCKGVYTPKFGERTFRQVVNATVRDLARHGMHVALPARVAATKTLTKGFQVASNACLRRGQRCLELASEGAVELMMSPSCRRRHGMKPR